MNTNINISTFFIIIYIIDMICQHYHVNGSIFPDTKEIRALTTLVWSNIYLRYIWNDNRKSIQWTFNVTNGMITEKNDKWVKRWIRYENICPVSEKSWFLWKMKSPKISGWMTTFIGFEEIDCCNTEVSEYVAARMKYWASGGSS